MPDKMKNGIPLKTFQPIQGPVNVAQVPDDVPGLGSMAHAFGLTMISDHMGPRLQSVETCAMAGDWIGEDDDGNLVILSDDDLRKYFRVDG